MANLSFDDAVVFDESGASQIVKTSASLLTLTGLQTRLFKSRTYFDYGVNGIKDGFDFTNRFKYSFFGMSQYFVTMISNIIGDFKETQDTLSPTATAYVTKLTTSAGSFVLIVRYKDASRDDFTISSNFTLPQNVNLSINFTRVGQTLTAILRNDDADTLIKTQAVTTASMSDLRYLYAQASLDDNNNTRFWTGTIGPFSDNNIISDASIIPPQLLLARVS